MPTIGCTAAVQQECEAIEAYRGTVCRFMGGGVMAMFGAPVAYEDHAVQARSAALDLQARMNRYSDDLEREHGRRIQARVGLHAGEVVVLQVGDAGKSSTMRPARPSLSRLAWS